MARPASRYFTPVIKKLLAARKQEDIVVDKTFKASLRAELLAGRIVAPQIEKWRRMDFFRKWKYQIAFVPTALLLVVVATQVVKLPQVTIQSQTVVPVAGTQNNDVSNVSTSPSARTLGVEQNKVQTFAGSSVLPSWYRRGVVTGSTGQTVYEQPVSNLSSAENVPGNVPEYADSQGSASVPASGGAQGGESATSGQRVLFAVPTVSSPNSAVPDTNQKVPGTAAGDVPMNDVVPPDSGIPVETVVPAPVNTSVNLQIPLQLEADTQIPVQESIRPSYALLYQIDLSDAEKTKFETEIVVPFTMDRNVSLVSVSWAEPGVLAVDVVTPDGAGEQHFYRENSRTHLYQEVQYVTRYSYNNDLMYEPAVMSSPFAP